MNEKTISFKVDDYTIHLHRGQEESKEMEQERMSLFISYLCYIAMKPMIKYFEEYYPELQIEVKNIILKKIRKYPQMKDFQIK